MAQYTDTPLTGKANSKIYYPIYGIGSVSTAVSNKLQENPTLFTPTTLPETTSNSPSTNGGGIGPNYYSLNQSTIGPGNNIAVPIADNFGNPAAAPPDDPTIGGYYFNGQRLSTLPATLGSGVTVDPNIPLGTNIADTNTVNMTISPKDPNYNFEKYNDTVELGRPIDNFFIQNSISKNVLDDLPFEAFTALFKEATILKGIDTSTLTTNTGFNSVNDTQLNELMRQLAIEKGWIDQSGLSRLPSYQMQEYENLTQARIRAAAEIERKLNGTQPLLPGESRDSLLADAQKWNIPINLNNQSLTSDTITNNISPSGSTVGNMTQNKTAYNGTSNPSPINTGTNNPYQQNN